MADKNRSRIIARIPDGLREELLDLAEAHDRSLSYEIRRGLLSHVERATDPGASPPPRRSVMDEREGGDLVGDRRSPSATPEQA
jgi:hypothetical protein